MKVYKMNDYDWYMAPTLEEAIAAICADTELPVDEATYSPHELIADEMERLTFTEDDGEKVTFTEALRRRMESDPRTQMFASSLE